MRHHLRGLHCNMERGKCQRESLPCTRKLIPNPFQVRQDRASICHVLWTCTANPLCLLLLTDAAPSCRPKQPSHRHRFPAPWWDHATLAKPPLVPSDLTQQISRATGVTHMRVTVIKEGSNAESGNATSSGLPSDESKIAKYNGISESANSRGESAS